MSQQDCTVTSNYSIPQIQGSTPIDYQMQNEENKNTNHPLRPQHEHMDIESLEQKSISQQDREDSEFMCRGRGRPRCKKINKIKKGNSSQCPPKPLLTRTKRSNQLQKLKSSQHSIQWFILKDQYVKTSLSCFEDVLNRQNVSPVSIEQNLNKQTRQKTYLSMSNPQDTPPLHINQVLVHYQTFQFKNDNLRVYCWSLAPSQNEEILSRKRTRTSSYIQMDDDDILIFQKLGLSQQNTKIYFKNAKYRFRLPNVCRIIEQLNKNQTLTARNKHDEFIFHSRQQVPVPKLLKNDELARHVATKREMLARRTASLLQDE